MNMIGHDDEFIQRNIGVVRRDGADGLIYHTANGGKLNTCGGRMISAPTDGCQKSGCLSFVQRVMK